MGRIWVAGSINMDVVARTQRHPQPGETIFGRDLRYIPGGKGSNQAVAASRLGEGVGLVGRLGRDPFGSALHDFLKGERLDLQYLRFSEETASGIALIVVSEASENTIVVVSGSNSEVSPADVDAVPLQRGDIVGAVFEVPQETILSFFRRARQVGARTVLNPAPAGPFIQGLLDEVDVLVVNETELAQLSGSAKAGETPEQIRSQAASLRSRDSQIVVVTLGARGAVALNGDSMVVVEGRRVKAVDTTGAGDCYVGALEVALNEGMQLEDALRFANTAASISVTRVGASASLPTRDEVNAALRG